MSSGYILINVEGLDIGSFDEAITVQGVYNLLEAAIDTSKPVMIVGATVDGNSASPTFVTATRNGGAILVRGFDAIVTPDDKMTPITINENN